MKAAFEPPFHHFFYYVVDGVVDALDHARQHEPLFDAVLIRIDANNEMRCASVHCTRLLDRIERAETRIPRRREDDIRPFVHLCERQLFAFARIVPCRVGDADIILDDLDPWVPRPGTLFVPFFKTANEWNVHTADEADSAGA